jgi:hypothetical protein
MSADQVLALIEQAAENDEPLPAYLTRTDLESARSTTGRPEIIQAIDDALQGLGE